MSDVLEDGRSVADLKVVELREELQKRNLSKTGNKKELADRLRNYLLTGAGEYSDKSASHSPVKSPVNSLIAQYRSTQQQLLKDVHKDSETDDANGNAVENGHKDEAVPEQPDVIEKQPSPVIEKQAPSHKDAKEEEHHEELPPPVSEESKVVEDTTPEIKESVPKEPSPKRSPTPEPPKTEAAPPKKEKSVSVEPSRSPSPERGISKEPEEEPTKSRSKSAESETEALPSPPKKAKTPEPNDKQEIGEELDYEEDAAAAVNLKTKEVDEPKKKSEVYTEGIVYVKDEEAPRPKPRKSIAQSVDEDRTEEGFVRKVNVSPARYPPSTYLQIRGLRRPFTPAQWFAVLEKFGTFDRENDHWMDGIKSTSIVRYPTVEEAVKARDALHHVLWPEGNGSELLVDFTEEEEFIERKGIIRKVIVNDDDDERSKKRSASPMESDELQSLKRKNGKDDEDVPSRKRPREEPKNLEDLFRKTIAAPSIYYLPLSDEEAARKSAENAIKKKRLDDDVKPDSASSTKRPSASPRRRRSPSPRRRSSPRKRSPIPSRRRSPSPRRSSPSRRRSPSPRKSPPSRRRSPSPRKR